MRLELYSLPRIALQCRCSYSNARVSGREGIQQPWECTILNASATSVFVERCCYSGSPCDIKHNICQAHLSQLVWARIVVKLAEAPCAALDGSVGEVDARQVQNANQ